MKRYSIAPLSSRRKSAMNSTYNEDSNSDAREELERLEQETTLVLQEIDKNISRGNAVINDRLIPIIKDYSIESKKVWNNAGFWKYFFEQSANVELNSYEDPINTGTDVNTMANTGNNLLFNDYDDEEVENDDNGKETGEGKEDERNKNEIGQDINSSNKNNDNNHGKNPHFKKPILKNHVEDSTPTWSTEQTKQPPGKQIQSSTPQFHKRPSVLPSYNRHHIAPRYEPSDSIGMVIPPVLNHTLTSSEGTTTKSTQSPSKISTIRQSLDAYHRVSISPKKVRTVTPGPSRDLDEVRRRSSMIRDLINSSPTLPEPPILQSELGNLPYSSDEKGSKEAQERESFSPILVNSVFSPIATSHGKLPKSNENTIQRFPTTPKFVERLSGSASIRNTPLQLREQIADVSDLQRPVLQNVPLDSGSLDVDAGLEDVPVPELTTDVLSGKRKSDGNHDSAQKKKSRPFDSVDDNDNVFLDTNKNVSAGSTVYHSVMQQELDKSRDNTNVSQSRSISHLFEEVVSRISGKKGERTDVAVGATDINDIFKEVSGNNEDTSLQDHTENSTSELGPLRERWRNITGL
ncbi:DASH complex subunit ask1 [Scheffersomyces xylosifermentans]|uniref:DASH complex subunit ask1 n=1 Tax=Scheffersomyces xylosifermentans TaxID=1304137 RepID=UPI00315DA4BC